MFEQYYEVWYFTEGEWRPFAVSQGQPLKTQNPFNAREVAREIRNQIEGAVTMILKVTVTTIYDFVTRQPLRITAKEGVDNDAF